MKLPFYLLLPLALGSVTVQGAEFTTVLTERSRVAFTSKQMGVPVEGHFQRFKARLAFDPARPENGHTSVEIELASIDAGLAEANEEALGKNWFDAKTHPTARFVSSSVKALGNGRFQVSGQLSIKGHTRPMSAPFSFRQQGREGFFEGSFSLKRLDYALGEGLWSDTATVADEVQIKVLLVATPGQP